MEQAPWVAIMVLSNIVRQYDALKSKPNIDPWHIEHARSLVKAHETEARRQVGAS